MEIEKNNGVWESWLYHRDYGVKTMMACCMEMDITLDKYIDCIGKSAHEYIRTYIFDYMIDDLSL